MLLPAELEGSLLLKRFSPLTQNHATQTEALSVARETLILFDTNYYS